jgi:hypothetical protein
VDGRTGEAALALRDRFAQDSLSLHALVAACVQIPAGSRRKQKLDASLAAN